MGTGESKTMILKLLKKGYLEHKMLIKLFCQIAALLFAIEVLILVEKNFLIWRYLRDLSNLG